MLGHAYSCQCSVQLYVRHNKNLNIKLDKHAHGTIVVNLIFAVCKKVADIFYIIQTGIFVLSKSSQQSLIILDL